ncbi:MAG: MEDS domain-containing protein [Roseiflexaceae bacterium]
MAPELRKTGISIVGDMPWGTHFCCFYETKQDLLDILVPYFKAGLENKEFCLWVVSDSELITVEEAKAALEQAVPDLDRRLSDEHIEILNGVDWYLQENVFDLERVTSAWDAKLKRAVDLGYDGMRVSGDTFWLAEKDWKDFGAYEKQLNDSITDRPMAVLCTYPLAKSGAAEILDVVQTHRFAIARRQGEWKVIETPELIQAKAEIARLNEALQRVKERTPKPPVTLRYGLAVLSVTAALIIARFLDIRLVTAPVSLFLCALIFSVWYGGVKPGLLAMALSLLAFDYYFLTPIYSLTVEINGIPRLLIFALASVFVVSLSAAQRSAAESLRHARDVLDGTVQQLKRTNEALQAENAERKRAEALLHAKKQEFRAIVENAPDQIIRYDREFRRTYVNPAAAKAYDLPAEALIGKPIGSVIQDAGLDVKADELAQFRQRIAAVFATGTSYEYENNWLMPTGHKYYNVRLFPERDLNGSVINVLGIARDITERKKAEAERARLFAQLQLLSRQLLQAQEAERLALARELHDEIGQRLTGLNLILTNIIQHLPPDVAQAPLSDAQSILRDLIAQVRNLSLDLRPGMLDDLGLIPALVWLSERYTTQTNIAVRFEHAGLEGQRFAAEVEITAYRIVQEALTNVARHAGVSEVTVRLWTDDDALWVVIADQGRGFDPQAARAHVSSGLAGMHERAALLGGELTIESTRAAGTRVTAALPLHSGTTRSGIEQDHH